MLKIFDELETKRKDTRLGIPREEGEALYTFIKEHNIKRVVETGIAWGFTSHYILAALPPDGVLISLELHKTVYTGIMVPEKWHNKWIKYFGSTTETLKETFLEHRDIDLFFHDSCHNFDTQMFEYKTALAFVKYLGSHDIKLQGPPYAWNNFIIHTGAPVLVKKGQLGIAQIKK